MSYYKNNNFSNYPQQPQQVQGLAPMSQQQQLAPQATAPAVAHNAAPAQAPVATSFIQYSSISYYDNRGTTDKFGKPQDTQAWDIRFNQAEAVALLNCLQEAIAEGQGRGVVVRFTTGKRGNQKYESGGFTVKGKKEKQQMQYTPRR